MISSLFLALFAQIYHLTPVEMNYYYLAPVEVLSRGGERWRDFPGVIRVGHSYKRDVGLSLFCWEIARQDFDLLYDHCGSKYMLVDQKGEVIPVDEAESTLSGCDELSDDQEGFYHFALIDRYYLVPSGIKCKDNWQKRPGVIRIGYSCPCTYEVHVFFWEIDNYDDLSDSIGLYYDIYNQDGELVSANNFDAYVAEAEEEVSIPEHLRMLKSENEK